MTRDWIFLTVAILFEISGTFFLKLSGGFDNKIFAMTGFASFLVSFALAGLAFRTIDVGVAYSIWAGFGIAGITLLGIVVLNEPFDWWRLFFISLIICGAVGLHRIP